MIKSGLLVVKSGPDDITETKKDVGENRLRLGRRYVVKLRLLFYRNEF